MPKVSSPDSVALYSPTVALPRVPIGKLLDSPIGTVKFPGVSLVRYSTRTSNVGKPLERDGDGAGDSDA